MNFFEKDIKDRFKNASSLDGIDPDALWNELEPAISDSPSKPTPFFWGNRGIALLLLFAFLIGGIAWLYFEKTEARVVDQKTGKENLVQLEKNSKSESPTIEIDASGKENKISEPARDTQTPNSNLAKINDEIAETISKHNQSIPSNTKTINTNKGQLLFDPKDNNILKANKTNTTGSIDALQLNSVSNPGSNAEKNLDEPLLDETISKDINDSKSINDLRIDVAVQEIAFLSLLVVEVEDRDDDLSGYTNPIDIPNTNSRFDFGVFTGIHTIKNRFKADQSVDQGRADLLNDGFGFEPGYSFGIEAGWKLNKNISVRSGFEYTVSRSEFNLIRDKNIMAINPNSGNLVDAIEIRTVVHHNKLKYYTIPVLVEYQYNRGKTEFGVGAGIGLNFSSTQTGKSLSLNDEIAIYPDSENEVLPVSDFFFAYHLRPFLNYRLNQNLAIQLRGDFRFQEFGTSEFYNLNYSAIFLGGGLGLNYRF